MKLFVKRFFIAILVSLSCVLLFYSNYLGINLENAVLIMSVLTLISAFLLEKIIPFRKTWNKNIGDIKTDLSSSVVLIAVVDPIMKMLFPLFVITTYKWLGLELIEISQPFLVQLLLVTLLIELGKYCSHRLHHQNSSLWWLHAMHHSSERLYLINGLRFHPLNYLLNSIVGVVPAMLIGFSPEAILGYLVLTQPIVLIQHANIDLKSGWGNYLFSTNEAHRWHHSTLPEEANSNYGNALLIWDHVFGTFKAPKEFASGKNVGLFYSGSSYPRKAGYWHQLKSMFSSSCCV